MSVSFQPADLTTTTNTIIEEGESNPEHDLDTRVSRFDSSCCLYLTSRAYLLRATMISGLN
jgi:hypothetical protein